MLIGAASQSLAGNDFVALDNACGPFTVRRSYHGATDGFPLFAVSNAHIDYDYVAGKTRYASVISYKPDVVAMANGGCDAAVNALLASIPSGHPTMLTIWHEPDSKVRQKKFTVAQYKAAFIRFATLVHQYNKPNIHVALILVAWQDPVKTKGTQFADMWPGRGFADIVLIDGYDDLGTGGEIWNPAISFVQSVGVPWGVGECGTKKATHVDPDWMADQVKYVAAYDARVFCWFNNSTDAVPTPGTDLDAQITSATLSRLAYDDPALFVPWRTVTIA